MKQSLRNRLKSRQRRVARRIGFRYFRILDDELRPYLGASRNDVLPIILLPQLALYSAELMDSYVNQPNWRSTVEETLASF